MPAEKSGPTSKCATKQTSARGKATIQETQNWRAAAANRNFRVPTEMRFNNHDGRRLRTNDRSKNPKLKTTAADTEQQKIRKQQQSDPDLELLCAMLPLPPRPVTIVETGNAVADPR